VEKPAAELKAEWVFEKANPGVKQSGFRKKIAKVGWSRVEKPKFKPQWVLGAQEANLCIFLLAGIKQSGFRINSKGWLEQSGEPKI
jgi:hypothetical protein